MKKIVGYNETYYCDGCGDAITDLGNLRKIFIWTDTVPSLMKKANEKIEVCDKCVHEAVEAAITNDNYVCISIRNHRKWTQEIGNNIFKANLEG